MLGILFKWRTLQMNVIKVAIAMTMPYLLVNKGMSAKTKVQIGLLLPLLLLGSGAGMRSAKAAEMVEQPTSATSELVAAKEFDFQAPQPAPDNLPPVIVPRNPTLPRLEPSPELPSQPDFTAPTTPIAPPPSALPRSNSVPAAETFLVYVNGSSPLMLDQVKRVEPTAFRKQYDGRTVIQAGQFYNQTNAQRRAQELQAQGIRAEIAQFSGSGRQQLQTAKAYYVVIPAGDRTVSLIQEQVSRLRGDLRVEVLKREKPYGQHLAVGPFASYDSARNWTRYLKEFDINNARVYYGR